MGSWPLASSLVAACYEHLVFVLHLRRSSDLLSSCTLPHSYSHAILQGIGMWPGVINIGGAMFPQVLDNFSAGPHESFLDGFYKCLWGC